MSVEFFLILGVAVSLSMDAFSLSLAYGTLGLNVKEMHFLSIIVGIYHFIMPLLGMKLGSIILNIIPVHPDILIFLLLTIIGIQMIIESTKQEKVDKKMGYLESLLFGFAVSIDSFSVGIGILGITHHFITAALIFSLCSYLFTRIGLKLGKNCHQKLGNLATRLGGSCLIVIGVLCLL